MRGGGDKFLDTLSRLKDSGGESVPRAFLRALNPCAKLAGVLVFSITVVSFKKYEVSALVPFFALPVFAAALLKRPAREFFLKAAPAVILAATAAAANLFLDSSSAISLGGFNISYGMLSFTSLVAKAFLCVSAAIVLARVSTPNDIAAALGKFGVPCVLVLQIIFMSRYLETLVLEAARISRAYSLRSPAHPKIRFSHFPNILLSLILRSVERAQRIYTAMKCRGFNPRAYKCKSMPMRLSEIAGLCAFSAMCAFFRLFNISEFLGGLVK